MFFFYIVVIKFVKGLVKMMKEEKKPFQVKEVGEAVGKEFYLVVAGTKTKQEMVEELKNHKISIIQMLKNTYWGLRNRLSKDKEKHHKYEDIDGCLLEIVKRDPGYIDSYLWGNSISITFEDGKPVGDGIEGVMEYYFLVPESARVTENNEIILGGSISKFNISANKIEEPLEKKVTVLLDYIPKYKSSGTTLIC